MKKRPQPETQSVERKKPFGKPYSGPPCNEIFTRILRTIIHQTESEFAADIRAFGLPVKVGDIQSLHKGGRKEVTLTRVLQYLEHCRDTTENGWLKENLSPAIEELNRSIAGPDGKDEGTTLGEYWKLYHLIGKEKFQKAGGPSYQTLWSKSDIQTEVTPREYIDIALGSGFVDSDRKGKVPLYKEPLLQKMLETWKEESKERYGRPEVSVKLHALLQCAGLRTDSKHLEKQADLPWPGRRDIAQFEYVPWHDIVPLLPYLETQLTHDELLEFEQEWKSAQRDPTYRVRIKELEKLQHVERARFTRALGITKKSLTNSTMKITDPAFLTIEWGRVMPYVSRGEIAYMIGRSREEIDQLIALDGAEQQRRLTRCGRTPFPEARVTRNTWSISAEDLGYKDDGKKLAEDERKGEEALLQKIAAITLQKAKNAVISWTKRDAPKRVRSITTTYSEEMSQREFAEERMPDGTGWRTLKKMRDGTEIPSLEEVIMIVEKAGGTVDPELREDWYYAFAESLGDTPPLYRALRTLIAKKYSSLKAFYKATGLNEPVVNKRLLKIKKGGEVAWKHIAEILGVFHIKMGSAHWIVIENLHKYGDPERAKQAFMLKTHTQTVDIRLLPGLTEDEHPRKEREEPSLDALLDLKCKADAIRRKQRPLPKLDPERAVYLTVQKFKALVPKEMRIFWDETTFSVLKKAVQKALKENRDMEEAIREYIARVKLKKTKLIAWKKVNGAG